MDKTAIKNYAVEARRKLIEAVKRKATILNKEVSPQQIENMACTWFNRLIVLRIMEVNEWLPSNIRILSSREEGRLEPEAIREIARLDYVDRDIMAEMLEKTDMNATDRLYRYVLIEQCKKLSSILPGIFKGVDSDDSYSLLPDSLISKDGIVYDLITKVDESNFDLTKQGQIEIIGWLYQFYISEKKDEVFAGLKKNIKINKDTIPAATQLFTPEWIVKYMVENSLGRLWLERKPNDTLKANWKYYLEEAEQEPEVAKQLKAMRQASPIKTPEDIKFIDPCMGSGHILVYAFDVLYQIYESEGYAERDIPNLILEKNLHGLDIDDRACQLAYFALMMKARSKNRRFFRPRGDEAIPQPMVYSAKGDSELEEFGSLIKVEELGAMPDDVLGITDKNYISDVDRLNGWHFRRLLSQKYDVVVTNPPYFTPTPKQADWVKKHFPNSKTDLCVVFIDRNFDLLEKTGYLSMITMHSWMFLLSYENFRSELINAKSIVNMAHLGARAFEEIGGEVVQTVAFVMCKSNLPLYQGTYIRLVDYTGQNVKENAFRITTSKPNHDNYAVSTDNFAKIPGNPIAYWISEGFIEAFSANFLSSASSPLAGICTGNNDKYFRLWHEIHSNFIGFEFTSRDEVLEQNCYRWFFIYKGGDFRRWYGNYELVINYSNTSLIDMGNNLGFRHDNRDFYFRQGVTWSKLCSGRFSARFMNKGSMFDSTGTSTFPDESQYNYILGLLNSNFAFKCFEILNPTLAIYPNNVGNIPLKVDVERKPDVDELVKANIGISRNDWDNFETSWDFQRHPLLKVDENTWWNESDIRKYRIEDSFKFWQYYTDSQFAKLKANEEELNRIFIDIYGLQDELTPEVEDKDVTIRKADLGRDIRSFISYAVGCMFGRYSLDEQGLIFAGGNFDPTRYKVFAPVTDNLIPIGVKDYFDSDIVVRFMEFVKTIYGEESLGENLTFVAESLYPNASGTTNEKLRRYFLTDFYKDHLKIYQKRPIYWLLDSGKKNGFKALIYLHRYNKDTIGIARTDYLHEQSQRYEGELDSLQSRISQNGDAKERATLQKEANAIQAALDECRNYDQIIAHIAHQQIHLDLDDGVKVNYAKFQGVEVPKDGGGVEKMDLLGRI